MSKFYIDPTKINMDEVNACLYRPECRNDTLPAKVRPDATALDTLDAIIAEMEVVIRDIRR